MSFLASDAMDLAVNLKIGCGVTTNKELPVSPRSCRSSAMGAARSQPGFPTLMASHIGCKHDREGGTWYLLHLRQRTSKDDSTGRTSHHQGGHDTHFLQNEPVPWSTINDLVLNHVTTEAYFEVEIMFYRSISWAIVIA